VKIKSYVSSLLIIIIIIIIIIMLNIYRLFSLYEYEHEDFRKFIPQACPLRDCLGTWCKPRSQKIQYFFVKI